MAFDLGDISINTATLGFRRPIAETIDAVARHGFTAFAPWRREVEGGNVSAIARQARDAGLRVSSYCRSTYIPAATKQGWHENLAENRRALADAAILGAGCFVLVVGGLPEGSRNLSDARQQVEDGISALLKDAVTCGVPLAIEPLHPMYAADRSCVSTIAQALQICDRIDPDGGRPLGVAIDVYHTWWDPDLAQMIAETGRQGRLMAYHINDWLVPTTDLLMDRGLPGDGVIDLDGFQQAIQGAGYKGLVEIEVFSNRLASLDQDVVLQRCRDLF